MSAPTQPPEQKKKRQMKVVPPVVPVKEQTAPALLKEESESEPEVVVKEVEPPKAKKELSEAKKEAMAKMFSALKAKREANKTAQEIESQSDSDYKRQRKLQKMNEMRQAKKVPKLSSYVTMEDLEHFKRELIGVMPKTIYKEVPVDRIVPKAIAVPIETVREKVVQVLQPPKKITGNELLDSIFFK
tara:strand:+ start:1572 stop:2132 length:561 start_codon:yes stop_codon:yes gene_type:complete